LLRQTNRTHPRCSKWREPRYMAVASAAPALGRASRLKQQSSRLQLELMSRPLSTFMPPDQNDGASPAGVVDTLEPAAKFKDGPAIASFILGSAKLARYTSRRSASPARCLTLGACHALIRCRGRWGRQDRWQIQLQSSRDCRQRAECELERHPPMCHRMIRLGSR
jgi:hypothetical protein